MIHNQRSRTSILGIASAQKLERFVLELANLPHNLFPRQGKLTPEVQRILERYPDVTKEADLSADPTFDLIGLLYLLRDSLRKAWKTSDVREREWYLFRFRENYHQVCIHQLYGGHAAFVDKLGKADNGLTYWKTRMEMAERMDSAPNATFLEAAAYHFQRISHRARHCANPGCGIQPYFLAEKPRQRYCSEVCAAPGLRESKRRWWNQNRGKDPSNGKDPQHGTIKTR